MHKRYGFTIVELLVVIVVIGILAGVTVLAYTGIQDRARNVQLIASADTAAKAIVLYSAQNGTYPATVDESVGSLLESGAEHACLGRPSDYPARDGFAQGECFGRGNDTSGKNRGTYSNLISHKIESIAPGFSVDTSIFTNVPGAARYRGILYYATTDSAVLFYVQPGDKACGPGRKVFYPSVPDAPPEGITYCDIKLGS